MDKITIEHNGHKMVIIGGTFRDMLKTAKGSFGGERAWFDYDRKLWVMPDAFAREKLVSRIEKRGFQVVEPDAVGQIAARQKNERERQARMEREQQREAARRQRQAERETRRVQQARAVAERIRVVAGTYQVGDLLNSRPITGFGRAWTETEPGTWGQRGTRYDESCNCCHRVTIIDNETELCERCGADGKSVTYQYAYFS